MEIKIDNNKNGEVSLKTTMPLITNEEMITIDNNLQNIVNELIQKVVKDKELALSQYIIKKQNDEKQQLIDFLEDKIKEYEEMYVDNDEALIVLQEVLDFVNKGGKDE